VVDTSTIKRPYEFPATLRNRMRVAADAPRSVALELCQQESPRRGIVHLVNYNAAETLEKIPLELRAASGQPTSARLLSPDGAAPRQLPVRLEMGRLRVTVPRLAIYAALVFDGVSVQGPKE
jgi:hypothetical protein